MRKVRGKGQIIQLEKGKQKGKCKRWQIRVSLGWSEERQRYCTRSRNVHGSYSEAVFALREFITGIQNESVSPNKGMLFADFAESYLQNRKLTGRFSKTTCRLERCHLACVNMHIAQLKIEDVTTGDIEKMLTALSNGTSPSGKSLSRGYLTGVLNFTNQVFEEAKRLDILNKNPCSLVRFAPSNESCSRGSLSIQQVCRFIDDLIFKNAHHVAFLIALMTGLRRGEICALSWQDVDFDSSVLHVRHSLNEFGELKSTKTNAGRRDVPMPRLAKDALVDLKNASSSSNNLGAIFTSKRGGFLHPNCLTNAWLRERGGFGLEKVTFHELRHTFISMLAMSGAHPKTMQMLAGHASSKTTMEIYAHVNLDTKRRAISKLEQTLNSHK